MNKMTHISSPLDDFMETLGQHTYGRSRRECWKQGFCIDCGLPALPRCHTDAGVKEYYISCLCEECFDGATRNSE